jgi:membrane-bound lytic murein transglycosylase D
VAEILLWSSPVDTFDPEAPPSDAASRLTVVTNPESAETPRRPHAMLRALRSAVRSRVTPWLLLVLTLSGIGAVGVHSLVQAAPSPALLDLSSKVHARGLEYGRGLELIASGDDVLGRDLLVSATDRMIGIVEECVKTPGCDVVLIMRTLSAVLDDRQMALTAAEHAKPPVARPRNAVPVRTMDPSPVRPVIADMSRAVALLRGVDLEALVKYNRAVKAALNDWLTWNRPQLVDAYENYVFLREETAPIYEKADLPEALLFALMAQETGVKVHAYSRAGAAGPLQFMPKTGVRYGLTNVGTFDMRLDPVASTRASAQYLEDQLKRLSDDLEKALAAYNGGESRVGNLHRKLKGASFWDPALYFSIPTETREYVPGVLAAAWIFLHQEQYGLRPPVEEAGATEIVLGADVSIGELTICLGTEGNPRGWFRTLRNLNPRRKGDQRIAAGEKMRLPSMLVPRYVQECVGDAPLLARARVLHDASYGKADVTEYPVKDGDTLDTIADAIGCATVRRLAGMNGIKGPSYDLRVGQRLTVPSCS